jgi:hypothetical protein
LRRGHQGLLSAIVVPIVLSILDNHIVYACR